MFVLLLVSSVFASEFLKATPVRTGRSAQEWKGRIIYQVLTDRFRRSDGANASCNFNDYCGGTYNGLIDKLDYIKNLGMNAIWVSPIVENTWGGYHGYWAKDFYKLNPQFGSEDDFRNFVSECHKRDIWVMVDVVYNHVGPVGTDFGQINPFNQGYHYHEYCDINYGDQGSIEYCRIAGLPDLNQENDYVKNELISWTHWLIDNYDLDGLRIDTIKHVSKDFWRALVNDFPNTYFLGEVFDGNVDYLKGYTDIMRGQFSYPMYYTLQDVFARKQSCYNIRNRLNEYSNKSIDVTQLGGFLDNHDNPRWLNVSGDHRALKNALVFLLLGPSIPVLYYGTEQGYAGGADPGCREPLWYSNFNENHDLYQFIRTAAEARKLTGANDNHVERYCDDDFYAFSRGSVLACITKQYDGDVTRQITFLPFQEGQRVREIYTNQYQTVNNGLYVSLKNGMPQIFVPA